MVREPEIASQEENLEELGMSNWKKKKLRDSNFSRVAMKKGSRLVCRVTWEELGPMNGRC